MIGLCIKCLRLQIGPKEREWLLVSSSADYHPMAKLLSHNPSLARLRVSDEQQSITHRSVKIQFLPEYSPSVIKLLTLICQRSKLLPLALGELTIIHL